MIVNAYITDIFKFHKDFYVRLNYHPKTHTCQKITIKEAEQLEVGQHIKLNVKWNEDGHGQSCDIVRPIEVLIIEEPKYRKL